MNRRSFFKNSLSAGAVLSAAPAFVPRRAWGANDRPAYGVIGTGGRGRYLDGYFQKQGAQCVALCDVYDQNLEKAKQAAPNAKTYLDYHDLLAQKGIDFVVIATPDHQHCPCLLAALAAKKDVYQEKPLSHSLAESQKMIQAVRQTDRIVQVGLQRRSAPMILKCKQLFDSGLLGRISRVQSTYNWKISHALTEKPLSGKLDWKRFLGSAPERPLDTRRFRSWRFFWDYSGGAMTDQGTHLLDVVQWFANSGNAPLSAVCHGQMVKMEGSETPDVFASVLEYPKFVGTWTLNYCNDYQQYWSTAFEGDDATMIITEYGFKVFKESWAQKENQTPIYAEEGLVPVEPHVQNFLECIKSRKEPNAPVEAAAQAVAAPHLANLALHQHRQVKLAGDLVTIS